MHEKFQVVAQGNSAVDRVRRGEAREDDDSAQDQLKKSLWLFWKNPENLSERERLRMEDLNLKHLATGVAYQMRLVLQEAYGSRRVETARYRFESWVNLVRAKADRVSSGREPMRNMADMVERYMEGILPTSV